MKNFVEKMFKRNEGNMKKDLNVTQDNHCRTCFAKIGGFTLAEVLITLGIIGVVAAITIPTLIQNHQKQVLVTQLKKTYSILNQGFKLAMIEDEVDDLRNTTLFSSISGSECDVYSDDCGDSFKANFKKYFNAEFEIRNDEKQIKWLNGSKLSIPYSIRFNDGAQLLEFSLGKNGLTYTFNNVNYYVMGSFFVDVNGDKGPNQVGRDIFRFQILPNGNVVPYMSTQHINYICNDKENPASCSSSFLSWRNNLGFVACNNTSASEGQSCAARIIENGWKMDY